MMKCPYCDDGVSRYSHYGFRYPCTICDGTGVLLTKKEQNARDLQKAWKRFLRTQNEKEKTKKENQKAEETD